MPWSERSIEARDIGTVTRNVYLDEVRKSLTQQLVAAYIRRTGAEMSPLAQSLAAAALGISDPVVKKFARSTVRSARRWLAIDRAAGEARDDWDNKHHARDGMADVWKF